MGVGKRDMWCWRLDILRERGLVGMSSLRWFSPAGDGLSFFCYGIKTQWAGIARGGGSGGHFSSILLSPHVKFNKALLLLLWLFSGPGSKILRFENVYPH